MSDAAQSGRIRSRRPAKLAVDPWHPFDVLFEKERGADCRLRSSMTVFLAGSECPFTCVFCDLWKYTLDAPTPAGAIPRQLEIALGSDGSEPRPDSIKLYNASNFFDPRAVPEEDLDTIAGQLEGFRRVIVECHPRLVGERCFRFAERLEGGLEVAMGLETVHPDAVSRLNKQMTLEEFGSAAAQLRDGGIGVRAFVLLSPPFVPGRQSVDWTLRTLEFGWQHGVEVASVIPVRGGNGELERLGELGLFEAPSLEMFEETLQRALPLAEGVVLADLWDAGALPACPVCRQERLARLEVMNRTGVVGELVECPACEKRKGDDV